MTALLYILTLTFWNDGQTETHNVILREGLTGIECIGELEAMLKLSHVGDLACEPDFVGMGGRVFE